MSKLLRVCSSCKHYPSDEHCKECRYEITTRGNTHWEPLEEFINKPCVSEQACHEDKMKVLEKIRDEISHLVFRPYEGRNMLDRQEVMEVFNKHMKEGEEV